MPIFAWNSPLVSLIFLKRSLVFPILLFSSISLHCSLKKAFYLSLLFFGISIFQYLQISNVCISINYCCVTNYSQIQFLLNNDYYQIYKFVDWLGNSGSMEKEMATHSSILAWRIPWTEAPGGLQSMGSLRVGHDWATSLSLFIFMHWRRKWQPTPVFLPGES